MKAAASRSNYNWIGEFYRPPGNVERALFAQAKSAAVLVQSSAPRDGVVVVRDVVLRVAALAEAFSRTQSPSESAIIPAGQVFPAFDLPVSRPLSAAILARANVAKVQFGKRVK